ncbi:MAG: anti-sigma factor [Hamadaea sp.]|uniref:anti-sigma factor n=1 Tax=Hamadaea sp. TaxID=2024425 RepID=UPI0018267BCC|nr:anti-sigma factor [Hamadaea sp.]NUT21780.1 anti-sigma factor [Hamadaea sp.]
MTDDLHLLTGAYALDALDDAEREAFERHLRTCPTCVAEVVGLREAAVRLADDSWSSPPPRLREQVLERVHGTRQLAPTPTGRASRWRRRAAFALAAGLIAAVAGGVTYLVQDQRVRQEQAARAEAEQRQARIEAVLTASDAVVRTSPVTGGGRITVVSAASQDAAVVVVAGADAPPSDRAYELWTVQGTTAHPAAVLAPGQGTSTHYVSGIGGADLIAMTIEPASGSATPTLPIVAQVRLA